MSLDMSIITIFLHPSRSKIGKISQNHDFCVSVVDERLEIGIVFAQRSIFYVP